MTTGRRRAEGSLKPEGPFVLGRLDVDCGEEAGGVAGLGDSIRKGRRAYEHEAWSFFS